MPKCNPTGELVIRTLAMPRDTNMYGHIFGGWVLSQMDLAASSVAGQYSSKRIVTQAINSMSFIAPVHVGDIMCCYADIIKFGVTSMHINVEAWVLSRNQHNDRYQVTEGVFVFVAVDENQKPIPLKKPQS